VTVEGRPSMVVHHEVFGRDTAGIPAVDEGVVDGAVPK